VMVSLLGPKTNAAVIMPGPSALSHRRVLVFTFSKV
jgi:hypothetical protein